MFTVLQYGIVSVRKSNALSNKTSLDGVNGGGKFSEEQIKLTLDGLRLLTFGSIGCSYVTASWIVFDNTQDVWIWLLVASILNFIVIVLPRQLQHRSKAPVEGGLVLFHQRSAGVLRHRVDQKLV